MNSISRKYTDWLVYIFQKRYITVNTTIKMVVEVGQQVLKLNAINMRPYKENQSIFIFEFIKEKIDENVYQPILVEYNVTLKNGKPDEQGVKMSNFIKMGFLSIIDYSSNDLVNVFGQLQKHKNKYVNVVIKHHTKVQKKGLNVVYDNSPVSLELFGKMHPMMDHTPYISRIGFIDKPFHSYQINFYTLIEEPK